MSVFAPRLRALLLALACAVPALSMAQVDAQACGPIYIPGDFGPYDYRFDKYFLPVVERAHFTTDVELLLRGHSTARPGGDIHYTLSKFPNHHRALLSMMKLGQKLKTENPPDVKYPVECYFERALRFKRNDTVARLLYVQYLIDQNRRDDALAQVDQATRFAGDFALTHFNIGLSYFELKAYDKALRHANLALKLGYQNQGLVDKLKSVGQWREFDPDLAEPADSAASATAPASAASATAPASAASATAPASAASAAEGVRPAPAARTDGVKAARAPAVAASAVRPARAESSGSATRASGASRAKRAAGAASAANMP